MVWRLSVGVAGSGRCWFLPWPASGDLQLEGETEKGADDDDDPENQDAVQRWRDGDRSDDVSSYEQFEA